MKEMENQMTNQLKDYNEIITHYKKEYDRNRKTNKSLHTTAEKILCNTKNRMVKL